MKKCIFLLTAACFAAGICAAAPSAEFDKNVLEPFAVWKKSPPAARTLDKKDIDNTLRKRQAHTDALKKYAPYILNEYDCIEREFKLPSGEYLDIAVFGRKIAKPEIDSHECTSWLVMPDLTSGKSLIVHKNRDSSAKFLIAQQRAVKGKHAWIGMGNFGNLGTNMGMNDKALTVIMNSGDRTNFNNDAGIGTVDIARILLENCASAVEAVKMLEKIINDKFYTHGRSGSIWFIADKDNAFIAENNAEHIAISAVSGGFAIRANSWDLPEMLPYSTANPSAIVGNNRREYAVRNLLFNKHQVLTRGVTPEMMAEASRIKEIPEDKKCYPLCGSRTNSAATFVIDQEFPEELSYAVMSFGCPAYTVYLPVPLLVDEFPAQLKNGTIPDAAMKRWANKTPLMTEAQTVAFEAKLNTRHRKAIAAARRILRKNRDRKQVAAILNKAFDENCRDYIKAVK